jgi:hypothetical protein
MARRDIRSETRLATARIVGRRWTVAMRDADWERFSTGTCTSARLRLTVVLERFCDHGERDLPRGAFRWLSSPDRPKGAAREGAFEARGTVLRGHATERVFFVTEVGIDPVAPAPASRGRGKRDDPAQRQLPLRFLAARGKGDG